MAKFTKAEPRQARLKLAMYGKQGSGKTFTALLIAEGLAKLMGKRVALVDTEHGTDFYVQAVPERGIHPEAFDIDVIYTRSITETVQSLQDIDIAVHGVVVIDTITHLWEATINAYTGRRMSNGGIPVQAWGPLKKPYKDLMLEFMNGNYHAILCGREGVILEEDEEGQLKTIGTKIKAEGETGYEPHILVRMKAEWQPDGTTIPTAFFEKDRTGVYSFQSIPMPNFATIEPLLKYLGAETQQQFDSAEETATKDSERMIEAEKRIAEERVATFQQIRGALMGSQNAEQLKAAWELTKGKKGKLGEDNMTQLESIKDARKVELLHV